MTSVERVWERMKCKALEYAVKGIAPTQPEAKKYVAHLMAAEHVDPKPTDDVIEFYARELIALASEAASASDALAGEETA